MSEWLQSPSFILKNDNHPFSPFHCVYKCAKNSNEQFTNVTKSTIDSLFQKASKADSVINYTRDEVAIALKNANDTVSVSMLQEIHLPDEPLLDLHAGHESDVSDNFNDGHNTFHVDNDDDILIESTSLENDCIDFGPRYFHHEDLLK